MIRDGWSQSLPYIVIARYYVFFKEQKPPLILPQVPTLIREQASKHANDEVLQMWWILSPLSILSILSYLGMPQPLALKARLAIPNILITEIAIFQVWLEQRILYKVGN